MALKIMTLGGGSAAFDANGIEAFKADIRGPVLVDGDDGYDEIRVIHNGMIDKRPALIVRCTGVADVIDAVNFARTHELLVSIRGGGHGVAGNALCDRGLMIDLSLMKSVRVDPRARRAWVQGGATLGDLDRETQAFGLVAPAGVVSETGIAGLTLGGGFGWMRGKYGLSIDNLLSVDIVTADGELRRASETENPDLFWAVRGGGGNFGIVTTFEFRLHPLGPIVMHCAPVYPGEMAREVLQAWHAFMADAPDEFTTEFFFWTLPNHADFPESLRGRHVVIPAGVYAGPADEGQRCVQALREIGQPLLDLSAQRPFTKVQSMFDPYMRRGELLNYWKSLYLQELGDEVQEALVVMFHERPATRVPFVLQDLRGASSRISSDATAFGDRSMAYMIEFNSSWTDPRETERNIAWTRRLWQDMRARFFSSGGNYLNMTCYNEDGESLVEATYGANFARLRKIKTKYDPMNLFRLNANITPEA